MTPNRLLIIRPDAIGDVVLMIPMIQVLKQLFPKVSISVMLQPYTEALLSSHPDVDDILFDPRKDPNHTGGFFSAVQQLKERQFDTVIFSYLDDYVGALCWAAGIKHRIGDGNRWPLRFLLTHRINQTFRDLMSHEVEQNFTLLQPFGYTWQESMYQPHIHRAHLKTSKQDTASINEAALHTLEANGWDKSKAFIIIHPSSGGGNRAWLPEKYAQCIQALATSSNVQVALTGAGKKDKAIADAIHVALADEKPNLPIINLVNKTDLTTLMAIIQHAACVIGTDTGPTHIAAAYGVPVISVSPTKFVKALRWGPWLTESTIISRSSVCDLVCKPYACKLTDCLDAIQVKDVVDHISRLLNGTHAMRTHSVNTGPITRGDALNAPVAGDALNAPAAGDAVNATTTKALGPLKRAKMAWLKQSGSILIVVANKQWLPLANQTAEALRNQGFRVAIMSKFKESWGAVLRLRSMIIKDDVVVVHGFGLSHQRAWKALQNITALSVYCPPAVCNDSAQPSKDVSPSSLFSMYRDGFKGATDWANTVK